MSKILGWAFPCRRLLAACDGDFLAAWAFTSVLPCTMRPTTVICQRLVRYDTTYMLAFRAPFAFSWALPVLEGLAYFYPLRSLSGNCIAILNRMRQGRLVLTWPRRPRCFSFVCAFPFPLRWWRGPERDLPALGIWRVPLSVICILGWLYLDGCLAFPVGIP